MKSLMNVDEEKRLFLCPEHSKWYKIVSAYPVVKKRNGMYALTGSIESGQYKLGMKKSGKLKKKGMATIIENV